MSVSSFKQGGGGVGRKRWPYTSCNTFSANLSCNFLERMGHLILVLGALPVGTQARACLFTGFAAARFFGVCAQLTGGKDVPWGKG